MKKISVAVLLASLGIFSACNKNSQCVTSISSSPSDPVVAVVDGQPINQSDFEKGLAGPQKGSLVKAQSEMYEAKMAVLEEYIFELLVEKEAKKKNISKEDYLKGEIESKLASVSEKDIQQFYDKVKAQMGPKVPPLNDDIKDKIRQQLTMQASSEKREKLNAALTKKYNVTFALDRPRMDVAVGTYPPKGAENAKVTIVEFSDFHCPFCKRGADTMKEVMKKYGSQVKYYFRDYPLPMHNRASAAANAARCAAEQGKFWPYHDKLFEEGNQKKTSDEDFIQFGKAIGLDLAKFEPCVKEMKLVAQVQADQDAGADAGVSGTPAYFINGIFLSGALPIEKFEEIIKQELKK